MFTLIAYSETIPTSANAYTAVAAVADQTMKIEGDRVYIGDLNQIVGYGVACGQAVSAAYLSSPSLRRVALLDILPIRQSDDFAVPKSFAFKPDSPLSLEPNEGLEAYVHTNEGSPTDSSVIGVLLADGPISPVSGEIFHVKATATITEVADTWVNTELTWRQTLPVGRYAIVGAMAMIVDGMLFRFAPIGGAYRPGGVCGITIGDELPSIQRNGGLGVWCEFDQVTPPSVDILSNEDAAGTALQMVIDLIKIA